MERLANYELLSNIAHGGMAEIWLARQVRDERDRTAPDAHGMCVIKKLLPQLADNDEYKRMFLEEGRLGASLVHPNIVRMFDFGSHASTHYLAMEYLHGEDLRVVNQANRSKGRTMPLVQSIDVIARACTGLHHAHELRGKDGTPLEIVHRDVSPHNVFLTFDGGVKIVDFGIAKSVGRRWETKHGTLKGKVPYMSPEQVKGRRLDRRTDVYAMGIMLYELVLGCRPYVLAAGGDFALMMAIARHDIRPPHELAPAIDPELEAILLRSVAYDPKSRYQTMLEMSTALEEFATSRKLQMGPAPLAAYLETLFGARVEAWKAAQNQDLAAHILQVEADRARSGIYDEEADGSTTFADGNAAPDSKAMADGVWAAAPRNAASLIASTSSAVAAVIEVFGTTVVTLEGRIDEGFEGAALGSSLSGCVLFDLKNVERVTSFGVREWLEMMKALDEQEDVETWLARCPEALATQMSLIRTFAGKAKLLSFQAPFLCDDCGNSMSKTLDCEREASWFREGRGETPRCSCCGGTTKLDDDPAFLSFAAPYAGLAVPERIRMILDTIEQSEQPELDIVDKIVTKDETRVRLHRNVDRAVRWKRVFDGVEGRLVLDFRGVPRASADGATNFARAIKALGREVTEIEILECPASVLMALGDRSASSNERMRIASVAFAGRCSACAAARTGLVPITEVTAAAALGMPPFVPCRRCNAALDVSDTAPSLISVFNPHASAMAHGSMPAFEVAARQPPRQVPAPPADASATPPKPPRASWRVVAAATAGLLVAFFAVTTVRTRGTVSSTASSTLTNTNTSFATPGPRRMENSSVDIGPDTVDISVVLQSPSLGGEDDMTRAHSRAVLALIDQLERTINASVREASMAAAPNSGPLAIEERFVRDVGAFALPKRLSVQVDDEGGLPRLSARYRIERTAWNKAVSFYESTRDLFGITLARSLPSRRDGLVVVAVDGAHSSNISVGAVMFSLDERPLTSELDELTLPPRPNHRALLAVGTETISVELK